MSHASCFNEQQGLNPEHLDVNADNKHGNALIHQIDARNPSISSDKTTGEICVKKKTRAVCDFVQLWAGALREEKTQQVLYCRFCLFPGRLNKSVWYPLIVLSKRHTAWGTSKHLAPDTATLQHAHPHTYSKGTLRINKRNCLHVRIHHQQKQQTWCVQIQLMNQYAKWTLGSPIKARERVLMWHRWHIC